MFSIATLSHKLLHTISTSLPRTFQNQQLLNKPPFRNCYSVLSSQIYQSTFGQKKHYCAASDSSSWKRAFKTTEARTIFTTATIGRNTFWYSEEKKTSYSSSATTERFGLTEKIGISNSSRGTYSPNESASPESPICSLELAAESKELQISTLLDDERIQEKALNRLDKIKDIYRKINAAISFYNQGERGHKETLIANLTHILNNLLPRPDNWGVISSTENSALHSIFDSIQQDCLNLKSILNPLSSQEIEEAAAISAYNLQLEALLLEEQQLLNSHPLFQTYLKQLKNTIKKLATQPNGVYFAYAWPSKGSESREDWIQDPFLITLKQHLEQAGIETVKMDIRSNRMGQNIYNYMDQIPETDYVLLFGSPSLKEKHDKGTHKVCTELNLILDKREKDREKKLYRVFPILLSGSLRTSFPREYEGYTTASLWLEKGYLANFQKLYLELFGLAPEHHLKAILPPAKLQLLLGDIQDSRARACELISEFVEEIAAVQRSRTYFVLPSSMTKRQDPSTFITSLKELYLSNNTIDLLLDGKKIKLENTYTTLAIISEKEKKEQIEEIKGKKPNTEVPVYESIFMPKEPIALEDVFKHLQLEQAPKKRIVIQGSAGIGKSTLCHYIPYKWAKGELWPEFKAVFWLKFRDLNLASYPSHQGGYTTSEVLSDRCGFLDKNYETLLKDEHFRKNCLIILDGYDELSNERIRFKSFKGKSCNVLEAFQEDFDNIIVTTRPQTIRGFQKNLELEILGFEDKGIRNYIDHFFGDERKDEKKAFQAQLKHPLVYSLCHIPINLEIFCSLAYEGTIFNTENLTIAKIYNTLTDWLIERYGLDRLNNTSFLRAFDKETIDRKEFIEIILETIAWELMKANSFYITANRLQEIIRSFGALNSGESIKVDQIGPLRIDKNNEGVFIHLTFQEFFASKYLTRLLKEGRLEEAKKIIAKKKFDPRYRLVMQMTAGLFLESRENPQTFFDLLFAEPRDLGKSAELILLAQCFEECPIAAEIEQYEGFVEDVIGHLQSPIIPTDLKADVLNKNRKLLHNPKIFKPFFSDLKNNNREAVDLLTQLAMQKKVFPEEMINELIAFLKDPKVSSITKHYAAEILGNTARGGTPLPEKATTVLVSLLADSQTDALVNGSAATALGNIAKGGTLLPEKAISMLISLLADSQTDPHVKRSAAYVLGSVAKEENSIAEKAITMRIPILTDSQANHFDKFYSASLGNITKEESPLAGNAIAALISLLSDSQADPLTKSAAAASLGNIVKEESPLAENAIAALASLLSGSQADSLANVYAAALGNIAKSGTPLSEKAIAALVSLLSDSQADSLTKSSAAAALGNAALGRTAFPEKVIYMLISLLKDSEANYLAKDSAAIALGNIIKEESPLAEKAIAALISLLTDSQADSLAKGSAAALGNIAKRGVPLPKKAITALISLLTGSQADSFTKGFAAAALGNIAKGGTPFPEKAIRLLSSFATNSQVDPEARTLAYQVLNKANLKPYLINNQDMLWSLIDICKLTGKAIYLASNRKYEIADHTEVLTFTDYYQESQSTT